MIRILLLGLVLAGVWYLYRMVTQQKPGAAPLGAANDAAPVPPSAADGAAGEGAPAAEPRSAEASGTASTQAAADEAAAVEAEELVECPLCHAYVPERAHDGCGRPDCPIPALAAAREQPQA